MTQSRGILIAGNWKMNHGLKETENFLTGFSTWLQKELPNQTQETLQKLIQDKQLRLCIAPPILSLEKAQRIIQKDHLPLHIAAQNVSWEKSGAFTGEVSGPMVQEIGVNWALVGHSERRQLFGETDATVQKRANSLIDQGFTLILCIGETQAERESHRTEAVLKRQLREGFPKLAKTTEIKPELLDRIILAYEPVWAIGTGLTATPEIAEEAHRFIRSELKEILGSETASRISILYGGSVTPQNADSLLACPNIDGMLVGGASLKLESFCQLIQSGMIASETH